MQKMRKKNIKIIKELVEFKVIILSRLVLGNLDTFIIFYLNFLVAIYFFILTTKIKISINILYILTLLKKNKLEFKSSLSIKTPYFLINEYTAIEQLLER